MKADLEVFLRESALSREKKIINRIKIVITYKNQKPTPNIAIK
jgi:hypothetical protein